MKQEIGNMDYKYKATILAMEQLDCIHDKTDLINDSIYFTIPSTFTEEQIKRSSHAFKELFGLTFKYKVNEDNNE
jgi:hypothetical protein